jgi:F-type H+/Na+-transporting ATPase subunit alpha
VTTEKRDIVSVIKEQIEHFGTSVAMVEVGSVIDIGDGVARIHGLRGAKYNELLQFPDGIVGLALNLEEDNVAAVILGDYSKIKEGDEVKCTGKVVEVPVGNELIGRVVSPVGEVLDGAGPLKTTKTRPVERVAPNVVIRQPVDTPIHTGIKIVDSLIPIGRGQRELIIGDRSIGKSAIAIDTIISQKNTGVICIYVAIGQKTSKVAQVIETLKKHGAMDHTIVVVADAADPASLQYIAPYSGCAIGEEFMEQGKDALIIYDDLTKHAWAYRQISLILRRPPGREAYPGDVFYLHSRLLERAARLDDKHGGGSLTALPIIEVQAGDLSAYIPTNVISITDGQIYLETDMFNTGIRPALNVGLSVSRVGGNAQTKAMRQVAGKLKLDMAQYSALATFAQFGTADLDKATRAQLDRGQKVTEILKQPQYVPISLADEVTILYTVANGFLDDIPIEKVADFEQSFHRFMGSNKPEILKRIETDKEIKTETEQQLKEAITEFKKSVTF